MWSILKLTYKDGLGHVDWVVGKIKVADKNQIIETENVTVTNKLEKMLTAKVFYENIENNLKLNDDLLNRTIIANDKILNDTWSLVIHRSNKKPTLTQIEVKEHILFTEVDLTTNEWYIVFLNGLVATGQ